MIQNQMVGSNLIKILGVICIVLFIITIPLMSKIMYERELALNKNNCLSNHDVWSKNYNSKNYSCIVQDQDSIINGEEYNIVNFNIFWEYAR